MRHASAPDTETSMLRKTKISRVASIALAAAVVAFSSAAMVPAVASAQPVYYDVVPGASPHDVAATPGGGPVYYTAQRTGKLGIVDPKTKKVEEISLGRGSSPHGVIVGPD